MKFTSAALSLVVVAATAATAVVDAFAPAPRSSTFMTSTTALSENDSMSFDLAPIKKKVVRRVQVAKNAAAAGKEPTPFFINEEEPSNGATAAPSKSTGDITPKQVRALFSLWNNALATGDSRLVASRYATKSGAVFFPTVSDTPRTDYAGIKDYFDAFLLKEPQVEILEGNIRIGDGWAQDAG